MFRIQTMNSIAAEGLDLFSADLRKASVPQSVLTIVRAGAGYNSIPVEECSERGIVVFNTPGQTPAR
jgi:D-3-phosphoglycerate dehydrogenase